MPEMGKGPLQISQVTGQDTDSAGDFDLLLQQEVDASENLTPLQTAFILPMSAPAGDLHLPQMGQNTAADTDDSSERALPLQVLSSYAQLNPLDNAAPNPEPLHDAQPEYQLLQQQRQWQPVLQSRFNTSQPAPANAALQPPLAAETIPTPLAGIAASPVPPALAVQGLMPAAAVQPGLQPLSDAPLAQVAEQPLVAPLAELAESEQDSGSTGHGSSTTMMGSASSQKPETGLLEQSLDAGFNEGAVDVQADKGLMEHNETRPEHAGQHLKTEGIKNPVSSAQPNNAPARFDSPLHKAPDDEMFGGQISERLVMMVKGDVQTARIQLDPPELGALEVKIKVQHEQMTVTFNSGNAMVRDALEGQGNKLRDLLAQQGLTLSDMQVGSQTSGQQQSQQQTAQGDGGSAQSGHAPLGTAGSPTDDADVVPLVNIKVPARNSLVDHFA